MDDGEEDISTRLRKLKQSRWRQTPRRVFLAANLCLLLVLVLAVSVTLALRHASDQQAATLPSYQGTDLGAVPAPNFQLVDQTGHIVSLAQLRGHPVVLTFLYTHCPGPCPLLAEKLHFTVEILGQEALRVEWVAVSLDPKGDTPASAQAFVATHHLTGRLQFLLGSQSRLEPIWKAYFNVPQVQSQLNTLQASPTIIHSVGVFVLDGQGRERTYLDDAFDPATLASDLRTLLSPSRDGEDDARSHSIAILW